MAKQKKRLWKIILGAICAVVLMGAIGFTVYVNDYYAADETAEAALESSETVAVEHLSNGDIAFIPDDPKAGVVFYPGGKVQAEAYAPLLQDLANKGFLCVLVPMPFNLAVFNINGADGIQDLYPQIDKWILMGHSLGGSMAASYANAHDEQWAGLVLLGSYTTSDLTDNNIEVLRIYGSNDRVMNRNAYEQNAANVHDGSPEHIINGGTHAQFGSYGAQSGDGDATIPASEQQEETTDIVAEEFL